FNRRPKGARLGIAGGLVAVVLLGTLGAASMFGGGNKPTATPTTAASPTGPPFAVQAVRDQRGFGLDVPAGWTKSAGRNSSYFDYVDPQDSSRWLRLNVESAGAGPTEYLQVVSNILSKTPS